jgi:hypothetical protein
MLLLTFVELRIDGYTVLDYHSNCKKSAEAGGKVSQFRQSAVTSGSYPVEMEKVKYSRVWN